MGKIIQRIIFAGFVLFFAAQSLFVFLKAAEYARAFGRLHFDYAAARGVIKGADVALKAKAFLPEEAEVELASGVRAAEDVALRYSLYPARVGAGGGYLLAAGRAAAEIPSQWDRLEIQPGVFLYARPGYRFQDPPQSPARRLTFVSTGVFAVGVSFFYILIGAGVLRALGFECRQRGAGWTAATGYLLGYGLVTTVMWSWLLLGGALGRNQAMAVLIFCLLLSWIVAGKRNPGDSCLLLNPEAGLPPNAPGQTTANIIEEESGLPVFPGLALALLTALTIGVCFVAVATPVRDWDGMSHWILKSAVFFHARHLAFDYTHLNHYPLLWPLNIAMQFSLLGGVFDQAAQWTSAIFFAVFIYYLQHGLAVLGLGRLPRYLAAAFVLAVIFHDPLQSWWVVNGADANAENIFMAYLTAAAVNILAWMKDRRERAFILAVVLGACLVLAKFEGSFVFGCLLFPLLILERKRFNTIVPRIWIGLAVCALFLPAGWAAWLQARGYSLAFSHFQGGVTWEKIWVLAESGFRIFFSSSQGLVVLTAFLYLSGKDRPRIGTPARYLLMSSALLAGFALLSHAGLSAEQIREFMPDTFIRQFIHAIPLLAFLWGSLSPFSSTAFLPESEMAA